MATTVRSNGQATRAPRPPGPPPRTPVRGDRHRLSWVLAGVVLVVGCALAFTVIAVRAGDGRPVLVLARPVAMGQVITDADLRTVDVTAAGIPVVPASSRAEVVGRTAAVPLVEGALLHPDAVGAGTGLGEGEAMVALALRAGRFPPAVAAGDHVRVVAASDAPSGPPPATATARPVDGVVAAVELPQTASDAAVVVTLQVPEQAANGLAQLGANGQASLVLLPARGS